MGKGRRNRTGVWGQGPILAAMRGTSEPLPVSAGLCFHKAAWGGGASGSASRAETPRDIAKDRFHFCVFAELTCQTLRGVRMARAGGPCKRRPSSGPGARQQGQNGAEGPEGRGGLEGCV